MGYARAAIECIVNTSSKQSYKATRLRTTGLRYSVSGIHKRISQLRRRRVSGWVMKKLQKGAWPQKLVLPAKAARACFRRFFAAPTPSAALASQLGKFPRAKRQPATRASSPRSNASPPTWNASPSLSPTKQPESQVFQIARIKSQATTRMQPYSARTASQIYRTALHKYGTIYRGICVSSY